ncbi:RHS repeat-associated core domain-containing protein [Corallococcus sp. M34]|uniref:RHS repeat domain-containing protein n=1 Tax=Citreicoccus inhibens TaxID=2849499 RepID=UPI001C23502A|nr:RHS repeat-associated core domain-containing protein [Citreicoccus inhibens]MBU8900712.1 RHS repeat-associated core domain-containing protein [Citreicoccus inhibens]
MAAPGRTVEFTTFNLPSKISAGNRTVTFRYDAARMRTVKRFSDGQSSTYVGGLYEVRRSAVGSALHVFKIIGAEREVAEVSWATDTSGQVAAQKTLYTHVDNLGSVETLSDDSGASYERLKYEPFGGRRYPQDLGVAQMRDSARVRTGFTGHEHDEEFGLINMGGRMYDSSLGRFLSPDAFIPLPLNSQSLNRYSYVFNNPLRFTDPTGFLPTTLPVIVYDSWYGGSVQAGGSSARFTPPLINGCNSDRSVCWEGVPDSAEMEESTKIPSGFAEFLLRSFFQDQVEGRRKLDYGKGGFMGFLAGVAPFGSLLPPPSGNSKQFYQGYAVALGLVGVGEVIAGVLEVVGGAAGAGATATGVGAPVGVAAMSGAGVLVAAGVATVVEGVADVAGAANVVQMANGAGDAGGGAKPQAALPKSGPPKSTEAAANIKLTKEMLSRSREIASGSDIDKVEVLKSIFGGRTTDWVKMKTWTPGGQEVHFYQESNGLKAGIKLAGELDPF